MSDILRALAGVPNASLPFPGLATSGQPTAAALEAFRDAGGQVVLDIRDPMEPRPFDEPDLVRRLGMEYLNLSVRQGALDDRVMDQILEVVRNRALENRPLLVHCASANRVAGALIPYFILDRGMDEETAVERAMQLGLRGADLMEWGLDYARRKGS
jgi:rhodanese-related sulfurtransferase